MGFTRTLGILGCVLVGGFAGCRAGTPSSRNETGRRSSPLVETSKAESPRKVVKEPAPWKGAWFEEGSLKPLAMKLAWDTPPLSEKILGLHLLLDRKGAGVFSRNVVAVTDRHGLYAFDPGTGTAKWKVQAEGSLAVAPGSSEDSFFYIQDNILNAVDIKPFRFRETESGVEPGAKAWRRVLPFASSTAPAGNNLFTFVGSYDRRLYCLNTGSFKQSGRTAKIVEPGSIRWSFETGGEILKPAVVTQQRVYQLSEDGLIYAFETGAGRIPSRTAWPFKTGGRVHGEIALDYDKLTGEDILIVGASDGTLFVLGGAGTVRCKFFTGVTITDTPWVVHYTTPGKEPETLVYLRCEGNRIFALRINKMVLDVPELPVPGSELNPNTKKRPLVHGAFPKWGVEKLWEGKGCTRFLARGNRAVYFLRSPNVIVALEPLTGNVLWELPATNIRFFLTNPADGTLYLGDPAGKVFALQEEKGF
ncbi:MAG: PQQ-binding-like beta-propeller repeat protein [Planctomycetota bacterium]